jgi:hypothetical protein
MHLFRKHPESPAEVRAEEKLDEATREVAWDEFEKEGEREKQRGFFGPQSFFRGFRRVPKPVDDPDPADARPLRDVLDERDA